MVVTVTIISNITITLLNINFHLVLGRQINLNHNFCVQEISHIVRRLTPIYKNS